MNHLSLLNGKAVLAFAVVGAAPFLSGCHHDRVVLVTTPAATQTQPNTIVVHDAPPPVREENMPTEPVPSDKAWEPGHWEYQNNNYTWVTGRYIDKPQPNAEYVAPHWENRTDGWVYVAGYWK